MRKSEAPPETAELLYYYLIKFKMLSVPTEPAADHLHCLL